MDRRWLIIITAPIGLGLVFGLISKLFTSSPPAAEQVAVAPTADPGQPQPAVLVVQQPLSASPAGTPTTSQSNRPNSKPSATNSAITAGRAREETFSVSVAPDMKQFEPLRQTNSVSPAAGAAPQAPVVQPAATASAIPAQTAAPSLADLIERVEPACVRINVRTGSASGTGSGFVANADGTLIVTNFHVMADSRSASVTFQDKRTRSVDGVRAFDVKRDLAVIQITPSVGAKRVFLPLAEAEPRKGESVVAFGSPRGFSFTASDGIVSGIRTGREIAQIIGPAYKDDLNMKFIQTTAPISPGNSGGPLVNTSGQVIGVNTWCRTDSQNLNFAVSASHIRTILEQAAAQPLVSFDKLPASKSGSSPGSGGVAAQQWSVTLPAGRAFSSRTCSIDPSSVKEFADATGLALVKYPSGKNLALAGHKSGTLDGLTIAVHEDGMPMVWTNFVTGNRSGNLNMWTAQGERVLFAQYEKDKLNGFCCLFMDGAPLLIEEYRMGNQTAVHLVAEMEVAHTYTSTGAISPDDAQAKEAVDLMKARQEQLDEYERMLRKSVRDYDQAERQARASALSATKRGTHASRTAEAAELRTRLLNNLRNVTGTK